MPVKNKSRKNYVLDTNVLLHDPMCIYNFKGNNVIIPMVVLEELDSLKSRESLAGYQSREASRELSKILQDKGKQNLVHGIDLQDGIVLRVEINGLPLQSFEHIIDIHKNDSRILLTVERLKRQQPEVPAILVSKDVCMRIKAEALGLCAEDYETDRTKVEELYKGYTDIILSSRDVNRIYQNIDGLPCPSNLKLYPNEFVNITTKDYPEQQLVARFDGNGIVPLKYESCKAWGLQPLNVEQKMAFELLMDPSVQFVSIAGGAGSGKTILATAVALEKVVEQKEYKKIIFVRPVTAAGNDIGYLPGSEEEKLRPWMGSFYDAIESLMRCGSGGTSRKGRRDSDVNVEYIISNFMQLGLIEAKTFTYMRGRTLSDAMVIVDEAQEITPHLAKLMLTRAGWNSKFVFLGDPSDNQIDNIMVDARSNGLVYVIDKMKDSAITGHVTLRHVERSTLAKVAEKNL